MKGVSKAQIPGLLVAAVILFFVTSAIGALLLYSPDLDFVDVIVDPYYQHVTYFSFYQALISTLLSVVLAIPVAHSLSRRQFKGKALLLKLFATTLVLPVLVGIFGLLSIYGNSGLLSSLFHYFDTKLPFSIYGLNGILVAHVFFNMPFATRLFLQSLQSIPTEQHQLSAHLGLGFWTKFKLIEWPQLRQQLPNVAGLVFMLCFTSFATVMALGGGPKSTTIELAIYQAIKFDFDLPLGAILGLWQMLLCTVIALSLQRLYKHQSVNSKEISSKSILFIDNNYLKIGDFFCLFFAVLFVIPPLLLVFIAGINSQTLIVLSSQPFFNALFNSLSIATFASLIAISSGILILLSSRTWRLAGYNFRADKLELIGAIILVTPALVISTGLFLLLRDFTNVFEIALYIVILVNALMALPYVIKSLAQPLLQIAEQYDQLCLNLGIRGIYRFYIVELRALKQPIAHVFALCFVLSFGDLTAISLFGSQDFQTLPLYLFQLLGSYQMDAAAVVASVLFFISILAFLFADLVYSAKLTRTKQKKL